MCFAPQRRALIRHLNFQKCSEPVSFLHFWRHNGVHFFDISTSKSAMNPSAFYTFDATTACTFSTSQLPKVPWTQQFFTLLTSKCASRHNGVHFFDIFRHLNFKRCSKAEVVCAFWLGIVLRATTARTFSTSQLLKVLRSWGFLYILTWKCGSRHSGVQLFISHLTTWLRTRRFSEPTFRPSGATNHWKNTVFRDFPTFSGTWIFFLRRLSLVDLLSSSLLFSSLTLPISAFHLSILSEVWLLNFLRWLILLYSLHVATTDCHKKESSVSRLCQWAELKA